MVHRNSSSLSNNNGNSNSHAGSRHLAARSSAAATPENLLPRVPPFLRKLRLILDTTPEDVAGWNEAGTVFEVLDVRRFAMELGKHFKGTEQTFVRQLHFYGFTKFDCTRNVRQLTKPDMPRAQPGAWSFSHPMMLRDSPDLLHAIQRHTESKTGKNALQPLAGASFNDASSSQGTPESFSLTLGEIGGGDDNTRQLEATVNELQSKLNLLAAFLEKEGYDPIAILNNGGEGISSKRQKVETFDEGLNPFSSGSKRPREQGDLIETSLPSLSLSRQTSLDFFIQEASRDVTTESDLFAEDLFEKDPTVLFQSNSEPRTSSSDSDLDDMGLLAETLANFASIEGPDSLVKAEPEPQALFSDQPLSSMEEEEEDNGFLGMSIDSDTISKAIDYIRQAVNLVKEKASQTKQQSGVSSEAAASSSSSTAAPSLERSSSELQLGDFSAFPELSSLSFLQFQTQLNASKSELKSSPGTASAVDTAAAITLSQMANLLPILLSLSQVRGASESLSRTKPLSTDRIFCQDNSLAVAAL